MKKHQSKKTPLTKSRVRKIPLKYCSQDKDRFGTERVYIRRKGWKKQRMKAAPFDENGNITVEFTKEYHSVIAAQNENKFMPIKSEKKITKPAAEGTINWLFSKFYGSQQFYVYKPQTKKTKRSILERYAKTVGDLPYEFLEARHVEESQIKRANEGFSGAADKLVKELRVVFNWAIKKGLTTKNPTLGIEKIHKSEGFATWDEKDIEKFRAYYPIGSEARLAFELLLNLGVRRSDVVCLSWESINHHKIEFTPTKGGKKDAISLTITPELAEALRIINDRRGTILKTARGKPISAEVFGNKMRKWCRDAQITSNLSSHGLRKAAATELAHAGSTEAELNAVFGWSDTKMAAYYTKKANKNKLADNAFLKKEEMKKAKKETKNVPLFVDNNSGETK
jgi:integrase